MSDINAEVINYREHFRDKVVYCNCDDPKLSNFFIHFSRKFKEYGLKRLIATCYKNPSADEYSKHNSEQSVYLEYDGEQGELGTVHPLHGDSNYPGGDFRSERCIEFLKQSDIVVTNPPFSLFREYVQQLVEYDKKFLIIGNQNAINFKEIFSLTHNTHLTSIGTCSRARLKTMN